MSDFPYVVGDTFEGSPIDLSRFLAEIMAAGGRGEFDGDILTIVYLPPAKEKKIEAIPPVEKEEKVEAIPPVEKEEKVEAIPPVDPVPEEDPPLVDLASEEVVPPAVPVSKDTKAARGSPKKTVNPVKEA